MSEIDKKENKNKNLLCFAIFFFLKRKKRKEEHTQKKSFKETNSWNWKIYSFRRRSVMILELFISERQEQQHNL